MTTNPDSSEQIDLLASRLLDGDISHADVPDHQIESVRARSHLFAELGERIRTSTANFTIDARKMDDQIRKARVTHRVGRIQHRSVLMGAAAILVMVMTGVVVVSRTHESGVTSLADAAVDMSTGDASKMTSDTGLPVDGSSVNETFSAQEATTSENDADDPGQPLPAEFSSFDDLAAHVDTLVNRPVRGVPAPSTIEGVNATRDPLCVDTKGRSSVIENVRLQGRRVQVFYAPGRGLAVYDSADCSLVAERSP